MDHALKKITDFMCSGHDEDEKEVFLYGLEAIVSTVECLGVSFLVCCVLGQAYFGFLFILFLSLIKVKFTVYHCKTRLTCCLCYLGMMLVELWYYQEVAVSSFLLMMIEVALIFVLRRTELTKHVLLLMGVYLVIWLVGDASLQLILFQVITTLLVLIGVKEIILRRQA